MITAVRISKSYGSSLVVEDLSLSMKQGEILTLFGPNGSGKSTIARIFCGLELVDSGILSISPLVRRSTSYVTQRYREALLPWRSAKNNILLPLELRNQSRREREWALAALLEVAPLEFDLHKPVYQLSGGQAQLLILLRAVITDPTFLILDEPTSAFDQYARVRFISTIQALRAKFQFAVLAVLHDLEDALQLSDSLLIIRGRQETREYVRIETQQIRSDKSRDEVYALSGLKRTPLRQGDKSTTF